MKAVTYYKFGSPDVLKIKEVEKPEPKENEILVKICNTTVSAVDSIFRKGDNFFARLATGIFKPRASILGTEFSGMVEEVGTNVKLLKKGDKVFGSSANGNGAHAEYICLPEDGPFVIKPDDITYEEAAAIPYGALTALPFLRDSGKINSGQKVLIIGASGSVGTFAVQFAKHFGAEVTGLCSSSNVELVKSLGADKVIDYTKEDFTKNGEIYDIIFDTVGKTSYSACKKSLSKYGTYLTAYLYVSILFQMLWTTKISKNGKKAIIAFTGLRTFQDKVRDLHFTKELFEKGIIKPVIDKKYPLEEIIEAHRYVDKGHKKGNVIIIIDNRENGS